MNKLRFAFFAFVLTTSAMADETIFETYSYDAYAKQIVEILKKSGSFATCSLEGREVETVIKTISTYFDGKFSTSISIRPYGGESSSMKACLTLNVIK